MPIKWSALKVSEAMNMAEEFVEQAAEPLEQAKIVVAEARTIADLPEYVGDRLRRLISDIERIDYVKGAIEATRNAIPDGAIEAEQERARHGSTQSLI